MLSRVRVTATPQSLLYPCLSGMRRNLVPGFALQLLALMVVTLYGFWGPFRDGLEAVGELKRESGYLFSAVSTALFGGVIPFLVLLFGGRVPKGARLTTLAFYLLFWVWKGVEVDAFYRAQAYLFGAEASLGVIAKKTLVDQFLYTPLWATPTQVMSFALLDAGFSRKALGSSLKERPLPRRMLVLLVSNWVVWIPTVCIIYTLPSLLQLPLSNLVVCFWCLLMTSISTERDSPPGS